jgi:hypothetical protein
MNLDEESKTPKLKDNGTGSKPVDEFISIVYPFEKFEIVVKITTDGKFVGIEEVRINKDFRSFSQMKSQKIFEHVDKVPTE